IALTLVVPIEQSHARGVLDFAYFATSQVGDEIARPILPKRTRLNDTSANAAIFAGRDGYAKWELSIGLRAIRRARLVSIA
ncbi:MAG: hypothetical protein ACRETL_02920, partial [Gammaproteobacteria bacterium]